MTPAAATDAPATSHSEVIHERIAPPQYERVDLRAGEAFAAHSATVAPVVGVMSTADDLHDHTHPPSPGFGSFTAPAMLAATAVASFDGTRWR